MISRARNLLLPSLARSAGAPWRCARGNVIVESALLMAPLLIMIFGFFELGRYFFVADALADAARAAARVAIVRGATSSSPATPSTIEAIVRGKAPGMVDQTQLRVTVTHMPNNIPGSKVEVRVEYPLGFFLPGVGALGPLNITKLASMTISR